MVRRAARCHNRLKHLRDVIAAVVIYKYKIIVLNSLGYSLYVRRGKFLLKRGREKTRNRLCHNDSVSSRRLIRLCVVDKEASNLLEHCVHHIGVVVAVHHNLGHVKKPCRERVRTDHSRKNGAV